MTIYCQNCGHILKATDAICPNCGSKDRDIVSEDLGIGREEGKVFVVELGATVGIKSTVDATINQALSARERGIWKKLTSWLRANLDIDDFSIGFPSGVSIKFRLKK